MDLIIGAGVSGLSYANFTNNNYFIVESENEIGGYCRTIEKDGFVWDYSGHFFHFRDSSIKDFVCKNIDPLDLCVVEKKTQIYYKDKLIDFPFQSNIHQLDKDEFIDCLFDLFTADNTQQSSSFKQFVYNNLGQSISDKFLIPYNEKLYACDLDKLDVDAMGRFFPKVSKELIVQNFKKKINFSYNDTFTYPKHGAIQYIESIYSNLDDTKLSLNKSVVSINIEEKNAILSDGSIISYDNLVSTIPFTHLMDLCSIEYNKNLYTCNKVFVFNLGFDKPGLTDNSWLYFPSKDISFYRVGCYNNIIKSDRMSLYVEIGFKENDIIPDEDTLLQTVLSDLRKVNMITDHNLISYCSILMNPAYVHISKDQIVDLQSKKQYLKNFDVYSIGRYGSWTYCSIEDNIIEALELANDLNVIK